MIERRTDIEAFKDVISKAVDAAALIVDQSFAPTELLHRLAALPLALLDGETALAAGKRIRLDCRLVWNSTRLYGSCAALLESQLSEGFLNYVKAWYRVRRVGSGLPWGCAMEASFRLINLTVLHAALSLGNRVRHSGWLESVMAKEFQFVVRHLEVASANNHYLLNLTSLTVARSVCPRLQNLLPAQLDLHAEFIAVVQKQFLADGAHFEASTAYHFLALEALALAAAADVKFGRLVKSEFSGCELAINFMALLLNGDGSALQIGDDDSSSCLWPLGTQRLRRFQFELAKAVFGATPSATACSLYRDFGLAAVSISDIDLVVAAAPNGQGGKGGHAHNDKSALYLRCRNVPVFIDAGTYSYARQRNLFRSSAMHNVVHIADCEPCNLSAGNFLLPDTAEPRIALEQVRKGEYEIRATHSAAQGRCRIERLCVFKHKGIAVTDRLSGAEPSGKVSSNLVLDPVWAKLVDGAGGAVVVSAADTAFRLRSAAPIRCKPISVSPCYGRKSLTKMLQIEWPASVRQVTWSIEWD